MPPGVGTAVVRAVVVLPVVLLVLFTGLLWLLGLLCGRERRSYITAVSRLAMGAIGTLLHGSAVVPPPPARAPRRIQT